MYGSVLNCNVSPSVNKVIYLFIYGACLKCGDRQSVDDLFKGISEDQTVSYYQWNTSDDGRVRKELMTCTIAEAEEDLMNQLCNCWYPDQRVYPLVYFGACARGLVFGVHEATVK